MQRSSATASSVASRLEGGRRDDHAGAVGDGAEVAHDHAEAVVEGHRDADAVLLGVAAELADEEAVVEDVVVRERRALGRAGGAARVLDVDRLVEVELGPLDLVRRAAQQLVDLVAEEEDVLELGQVVAHLGDHRAVVGALELGRGDQRLAARLAQRVARARVVR